MADFAWPRAGRLADDLAARARRRRGTVLGQPSPCWARRGGWTGRRALASAPEAATTGLVVLAVPGGLHEDRGRPNEKYNLPWTPDMDAVYIKAETR